MLYQISRFAKKLHIDRQVYMMLSPFYKSRIIVNEEEVNKAYKLLSNLHPNLNNSSLGKNALDIQYDLQIIIPAYNVEKYVGECIDSVIKQKTDVNYLCTIVNDGSTDGTLEIIKGYASHPCIEIVNQKNRGFSGARNRALSVLKGKYIMFLDSDDCLIDGSINAMMNRAAETQADIIQGGYKIFKNDGTIKYTFCQTDNFKASREDLYGFPWGKLYKAELFESVKFPEGYWFEDTLMSMIIYPMAKTISTVDRIIYMYRYNPKGISASAKYYVKSLDTFWIMVQLMKDRKSLHLYNDEQLAEFILNHQLVINCKRIEQLKNKKVDSAVFILSIAFFKDYFPSFKSDSKMFQFLENLDYKGYKLYCLFH